MGKIALAFVAGAAFLLTVAMLLTAGWTAPPIHTVQGGYRGLAMGQLSTPESERLLKLANTLPDAIDKASPDGDRATAVYKNVQVLTDLSADQFNRVMLGLAAWVALPHTPDWRWLLERSDSPWYPGLRLFRQSRPEEWDDVFERLAGAVKDLMQLRKHET